jgi:hypothetical protein
MMQSNALSKITHMFFQCGRVGEGTATGTAAVHIPLAVHLGDVEYADVDTSPRSK